MAMIYVAPVYLCALLMVWALRHVSVQGANPEILEQIRPDIKEIGMTGELSCVVSLKNPSNVVYWLKLRPGNYDLTISKDDLILVPNDKVQSSKPGEPTVRKYSIKKIVRTDNRITFKLIIRNLQEQDGGQYKCIIRTRGNTLDNNPMKIGVMKVLVPPKILLSGTTNTAEADVGQKFVLECRASGIPPPTIKWVREDGQLLPNGKNSYDGSTYVIDNIQPEHRGVYLCVASNGVKAPAMHRVRINIMYAPNVRAVQDTVGQAASRLFRVDLECIVSGYPAPVVTWWRVIPDTDGRREQLKSGNKYDIKQSPWGEKTGSDAITLNVLTISNVRSNDYTNYSCNASNSVGDGEARIRLFETTECQGSQCRLGNTNGVTNGTTPTVITVISTNATTNATSAASMSVAAVSVTMTTIIVLCSNVK